LELVLCSVGCGWHGKQR